MAPAILTISDSIIRSDTTNIGQIYVGQSCAGQIQTGQIQTGQV